MKKSISLTLVIRDNAESIKPEYSGIQSRQGEEWWSSWIIQKARVALQLLGLTLLSGDGDRKGECVTVTDCHGRHNGPVSGVLSQTAMNRRSSNYPHVSYQPTALPYLPPLHRHFTQRNVKILFPSASPFFLLLLLLQFCCSLLLFSKLMRISKKKKEVLTRRSSPISACAI